MQAREIFPLKSRLESASLQFEHFDPVPRKGFRTRPGFQPSAEFPAMSRRFPDAVSTNRPRRRIVVYAIIPRRSGRAEISSKGMPCHIARHSGAHCRQVCSPIGATTPAMA
jgi:hypothetical protein